MFKIVSHSSQLECCVKDAIHALSWYDRFRVLVFEVLLRVLHLYEKMIISRLKTLTLIFEFLNKVP